MTSVSTIAEAKRELRRHLLAARRQLSSEQLAAARAQVGEHVLARMDADAVRGRPWTRVCGFEPLATEPAARELLDALGRRGAEVLVPVLLPDNDLDWARWNSGPAVGPDAVADAVVVLVPALAVDRSGVRIGRGGGSYDRVLPRVGPDAMTVALLHRGEILERVPADAWDCRVRAVVTPEGWTDLSRPSNPGRAVAQA